MRFLITGICGSAGRSLPEALLERREGISICGIDNLMRPNSKLNRTRLRELGVALVRLTAWCDRRFGKHAPTADTRRIEFRPENIPEQIAQHAERHAVWLERSAP
jgi:nucleoside-diphosphate-sugar epimerase